MVNLNIIFIIVPGILATMPDHSSMATAKMEKIVQFNNCNDNRPTLLGPALQAALCDIVRLELLRFFKMQLKLPDFAAEKTASQ